jgi:SNW domain-containing protein 1
MAALASLLPQPKNAFKPTIEDDMDDVAVAAPSEPTPSRPPPPPYGRRQGFIPQSQDDFGDGGAYPEIHRAQYPLEMGRKRGGQANSVVPLSVDDSGKIKYDALINQGVKQGERLVKSSYQDLVPHKFTAEELAMPTPEQIMETTERTKAALERITNSKLASTQPIAGVAAIAAGTAQDPTFIRYTPANQQQNGNSGASTRIIRMVDMQQDPMEPPKFKHKKAPAGPPSPPVPVMRSPPRKITVKDQQEWKIPPCISNWKNAKGYTIALDKRLAADGRGLQEHVVNDKFSSFSEALFIAERNAREEVEKRNQIAVRLAMKDQDKQNEMLRKLAKEARTERETVAEAETEYFEKGGAGQAETAQVAEERGRREEIRDERRRDRDRERHLLSLKNKTKLNRDDERDVSEKIALGIKPTTGQPGGETMFDQRLFNQSSGMDSGFAADDTYNLYDKPLFKGSSANTLYRPKKPEGEDEIAGNDEAAAPAPGATATGGAGGHLSTSQFRPDKDFSGVDRSRKAEPRTRPVEFERAAPASGTAPAADPFGVEAFLSEAKGGRKTALDKVGQGSLHAGSAGGGNAEHTSGKRRDIAFEAAGSSDKKSRK